MIFPDQAVLRNAHFQVAITGLFAQSIKLLRIGQDDEFDMRGISKELDTTEELIKEVQTRFEQVKQCILL